MGTGTGARCRPVTSLDGGAGSRRPGVALAPPATTWSLSGTETPRPRDFAQRDRFSPLTARRVRE